MDYQTYLTRNAIRDATDSCADTINGRQENMNTDIQIDFTGAGHYWLSESDGAGSLDLGICPSERALKREVQRCVDAGSGEEDWTGWRTHKA